MRNFAVMYEHAADGGWCASALHLPVFALADSRAAAEQTIKEAIAEHLDEADSADFQVDAADVEYGFVTL